MVPYKGTWVSNPSDSGVRKTRLYDRMAVTSKIALFFNRSGIFDHFTWLINYHQQDSKGSPSMTIRNKIIAVIILVPTIISPSVSSAWFFSSASAENKIPAPLESIKSSELLSPAIAMASTTKADHGLDVVLTNKDALTAEMGALGTLADLIDIPATDTISTYVVESGDTLSTIAQKFNVSQNTIRWANNLNTKSVLRVGQKLTILPVTGVRHTVVRGDSVSSIAKKYKGDAQEIANYNGIAVSDGLSIGTIIIIPDGEITTNPAIPVAVRANIPRNQTSGVSATSGYFIRPVILTGNARIRKTQGFHGPYNAIDVGAPIGTPVVAMASGTVITTRSVNAWNGGYGGLVIIKHGNGAQTLYAHLSRINVSEGQQVTQGQRIGDVGNTGRSSGPHLHYEIRGIRPTPALY